MMNHITITATEAMRTFSDLLSKVHYQGKTFEIKRGREIIATIGPAYPLSKGIPISELNTFFENLPSLEKDDVKLFEKTLHDIRKKSKSVDNPWD